MHPMNTPDTQRIFIPLDALDDLALLSTDRLVAYQPGFVLFSQLALAPEGAHPATRTAASANHPAPPRAHPPFRR